MFQTLILSALPDLLLHLPSLGVEVEVLEDAGLHVSLVGALGHRVFLQFRIVGCQIVINVQKGQKGLYRGFIWVN